MLPAPRDTLEVSPAQGTTVGNTLTPHDLLALRAFLLLLDAWDRNSKPGGWPALRTLGFDLAGAPRSVCERGAFSETQLTKLCFRLHLRVKPTPEGRWTFMLVPEFLA